jgi:hypothetical protein
MANLTVEQRAEKAAAARRWQEANPERKAAAGRAWDAVHREYRAAKARAWYADPANKERAAFSRHKGTAVVRGIPFLLRSKNGCRSGSNPGIGTSVDAVRASTKWLASAIVAPTQPAM